MPTLFSWVCLCLGFFLFVCLFQTLNPIFILAWLSIYFSSHSSEPTSQQTLTKLAWGCPSKRALPLAGTHLATTLQRFLHPDRSTKHRGCGPEVRVCFVLQGGFPEVLWNRRKASGLQSLDSSARTALAGHVTLGKLPHLPFLCLSHHRNWLS